MSLMVTSQSSVALAIVIDMFVIQRFHSVLYEMCYEMGDCDLVD